MGVNQPDLTGGESGVRNGVPGGTASATQVATAAASPTAPQKILQQGWRPQSFVDFHRQMERSPSDASRSLDQAIRQAYDNAYTLQAQIACRQAGSAVVTGSVIGIPTGLTSVSQVQASIDNGATAHNFWLSATPSATPGGIDIHIFQPTAAGNNTPIACTTPVTVRWVANGSL